MGPKRPPPPVPSKPPPVPERLEEVQAQDAAERVRESIRRIVSPIAAEREFEDLCKEVEKRRAEAADRTTKILDGPLASAYKLAESLSNRTNVRSLGETAKATFRQMAVSTQALLTNMGDLLQQTTTLMLQGLQRRVNHMQNIFLVTAGLVEERNDSMETHLQPLRMAILSLQQDVIDLEEAAPLWRDRICAAEAGLRDVQSEIMSFKLRGLAADFQDWPSRGRSPALRPRLAEASSGCGSRASSRAASLERVRQATARNDIPEAVRQAQMAATLSVIDDATHPLAASAAQLWSDDHGRPFYISE